MVHARGLSPLPSKLQAGDAQRVLFAGEIGGVDSTLSAAVTRDLPYESVRLASFERRVLSADSPLEIEGLLKNLLPDGEATAVYLSQTEDGRYIAIVVGDEAESRWVERSTAFSLLRARPGVVVPHGGPLAVAVQLWRQYVQANTSPDGRLGSPRLRSLESAIETLDSHAWDVAESTRKMAEAVAPPGRLKELLMAIGPLGLQALIYPEQSGTLGRRWPIRYRHIDDVKIRQAGEDGDGDSAKLEQWGTGSVEAFTDKHPTQHASQRVRDAISKLASMKWL